MRLPSRRTLEALSRTGLAIGMVISALIPACGGNVLDVGHDAPAGSGDDGGDGADYATRDRLAREPDAGSGIPTVIATHQQGTSILALDDKRIYWTIRRGETLTSSGQQLPTNMLRSCAKDDCAGTLVTYVADRTDIFAIAVSSTEVLWVDSGSRILACPIAGCDSPRVLTTFPASAGSNGILADETHVYWLSPDGALLRCPLAGCGGELPELVTTFPTPTYGLIVGDATHLVWPRSSGFRMESIVELDKRGGGAMRTLVENVEEPQSLVMDAENVYWTDRKGRLLELCPRTGCGPHHGTLFAPAGVVGFLAVQGKSAFWFSSGTPWFGDRQAMTGTADLMECPLTGCASSVTRLVVGELTPCAIAVDATHVYWRSCNHPLGSQLNDDDAIKRIRR